ncbi:MAG: hypothetical protein ACM3ZA_00400 [Bacillota bacterium]
MVLTIGNYQISVQRRGYNREVLDQQEARRLQLQRQVEAHRELIMTHYREMSGQIRLY